MSFPHDLWCACRKWMEQIPQSSPYGCEALHCRPACIRPHYRFSCGWTGILYWPGHTVTTAKRKKTWVEIKRHSLSMPLTSKVGSGEGTVKLPIQLDSLGAATISSTGHFWKTSSHAQCASWTHGKHVWEVFSKTLWSALQFCFLPHTLVYLRHLKNPCLPSHAYLVRAGKSTHWQHVKPNSHENN